VQGRGIRHHPHNLEERILVAVCKPNTLADRVASPKYESANALFTNKTPGAFLLSLAVNPRPDNKGISNA
jgi:hypothetical protein